MDDEEMIRCQETNGNGYRCRRKTHGKTDFCWQHREREEGVKVKTSTYPEMGRGLFADRDFKAGEFLSYYGGTDMSYDQFRNAYGEKERRPYSLAYHDRNGKLRIVDAHETWHGNARFINDARNTGREVNAELVDSADPRQRVRVKTDVKKGEEFFTNYGENYWKGHSEKLKTRKRKR